MKRFIKRIRYLTVMRDMFNVYFLSMGVISLISISDIIVSGMPKEDLSFETLFMRINGFYPYMLLLFGTITCFEIFFLEKYRYLKGDCVCIVLESNTIAQVNEQAVVKMKEEQRLSEDIEKMKAVEYFQSLKDASLSVTVLLKE